MGQRPCVLILAALKPQSGNNTTANRICHHIIEGMDCKCISEDTANITSVHHFLNLLETHNVQAVLGVHAMHAGQWLIHSPVPSALIFGGTDVNYSPEGDDEKLLTMRKAVTVARVVVAFSQSVLAKAQQQLVDSPSKDILVIPQAVTTCSVQGSGDRIRGELGVSSQDVILTIVGGIRPVKDQLFVLDEFSAWHKRGHSDVYLVIAGPPLDEEYAAKVLTKIESCSGVLYAGGRSLQDTHSLISDSYALVNTSISEGQATAILESMALGVPVLARTIAANMALVDHRRTGLLFSSPEDFVDQLETLMCDDILRTALQVNAKKHVKVHHNYVHERQAYVKLVSKLLLTKSCEHSHSLGCQQGGDAKHQNRNLNNNVIN